MSSVVADASVVKLGGSKTVSNGGGGSAVSLKRKISQDAGAQEDVLGSSIKRPKAVSATVTANGNKNGIATNTIMITNNYSKDGLTPTSSTTTTTSNSSKITILARDVHDDDDENSSSPPPSLLHHHHHHRHRPMVVDQINICINNHFSTGGDASPLTMTTTTASATAKLPELIKIQKKKQQQHMTSTVLGDEEPKLGYEEDVKPPTGLAAMLDIEQQVQGFLIKKEPGLDVVEVDNGNVNQNKSGDKKATESAAIVHKFSIGEEVLVPRKSLDDSCFYLGILTVMRDDQCLVQFEDGTNCWASVREMRRLMRAPNSVYCVICKTRELQSNVDDDQAPTTTECVSCARAYHKVCLRRELSELAKKNKKGGVEMANCLR